MIWDEAADEAIPADEPLDDVSVDDLIGGNS
jgi:hypothetical protein